MFALNCKALKWFEEAFISGVVFLISVQQAGPPVVIVRTLIQGQLTWTVSNFFKLMSQINTIKRIFFFLKVSFVLIYVSCCMDDM